MVRVPMCRVCGRALVVQGQQVVGRYACACALLLGRPSVWAEWRGMG
jgi:hypothetical protein